MVGDLEALALYAGQSAGLVQAVEPAETIVRELVDEAEAILARLARSAPAPAAAAADQPS
jgi:nitronate monooxygenase